MALRINTNVESLKAQHELAKSKDSLDHTQNKLSSGSRIINAMDDAAGLAISESLRAATRATTQNIKNVQNGFYLLQTADGALNEITNIVIRMKELAVNAASDTNGDAERGYLDDEYQLLAKELNRISEATLYNGRQLLTGEGGEIAIQVGPNNNEDLDRVIVAADFNINLERLGIDGMGIDSADGARSTLEPLESALANIAGIRGAIGAAESRLNSIRGNLTVYEENQMGAFSQIRDADIAEETSNYTKFNILNQAGVAILSQANTAPSLALKLLNS